MNFGSLNTLKHSKKSSELNNDLSSPDKMKEAILKSEESAGNYFGNGGDEMVVLGPVPGSLIETVEHAD